MPTLLDAVRQTVAPEKRERRAMLDDLTNWATDLVDALGYLGVALLVALENLFPPIPSEVVLGLAGYTASQGDAWVIGMIIAATVGSVTGAWMLYGLSAAVGPLRLRAMVVRYGAWVGFSEPELDRAECWFDRRSRIAVLVCRCIPLIRSLISIPAGLRRMPLGTFTVYTLIGSAIWNTVIIVAGYLLAEQWEQLLRVTEPFQTLVVAGIGLLVVAAIARRIVVTVRQRAAEEAAHPGVLQESLEEVVEDLRSES